MITKPRKLKKLTEEKIKEIISLREYGRSINSLSQQFGVARTIIRAYTEYGSPSAYLNHLAQQRGFKSNYDLTKHLVEQNGFDTVFDWHMDLIKKAGYKSYKDYAEDMAKRNGFSSAKEYRDHLAQQMGFENHNRYLKSRREIRQEASLN